MRAKLSATEHVVTVTREDARCCDRHSCYVARCSCGWETDRRDTEADVGYAYDAIRAHKIDVLLHHSRVKFTMKREGL